MQMLQHKGVSLQSGKNLPRFTKNLTQNRIDIPGRKGYNGRVEKIILRKRQVDRMDSCDSHGRSCSSQNVRWKAQRGTKWFRSVLKV